MRTLALTLAVLVAAAAAAQEKKTVDNPAFANWAKFKAGTTAVAKSTGEFNGMKSAATTTWKLLEVKADELTLEITSESEVMGTKSSGPAVKQVIKKAVDIPVGSAVPMGARPEGTAEEGTETVKVANAEIKTKWYKFKNKSPFGEVEGQLWVSDEVPGTVVKMVSKGEKFSSTMELTEFKK